MFRSLLRVWHVMALHADKIFVLAFVSEGRLLWMLWLILLWGVLRPHIYQVVVVFLIVNACHLVGGVLISVKLTRRQGDPLKVRGAFFFCHLA